MPERIFVKVMGFTDVERHALNTIFRLSEQRSTVYSLWGPEAPEEPRLGLVDGDSYEAQLEISLPRNAGLQVIWVDGTPPIDVYRCFQRPVSWRQIIRSMDDLFAQADPIDLDLGIDTGPPTEPGVTIPPIRALIASADRDERLYLRAKLALSDLTQADEAETGAQALELARSNHYAVALVDFGLPDVNGWAFLKELTGAKPAIQHVIITKHQASLSDCIRGRLSGAEGFFSKPPHPEQLRDLLNKVQ